MEITHYSLERKEPYPFKVRREALKNMTNLPERWKTVMLARSIEELKPFVDENHRVLNWDTQEVVIEAGKR